MKLQFMKKMAFAVLVGFTLFGCSTSEPTSSENENTPCSEPDIGFKYEVYVPKNVASVGYEKETSQRGPYIKSASVKANDFGIQTVGIVLSVPLDEATMDNIALHGSEEPIFTVIRSEEEVTGEMIFKTYGYYADTISVPLSVPLDEGAAETAYYMRGNVRDTEGNVVEIGVLGRDRIAFNFPYNQEVASDSVLEETYVSALGQSVWDGMMKLSQKLSFPIGFSSGKAVFTPLQKMEDWAYAEFLPSPFGCIPLD